VSFTVNLNTTRGRAPGATRRWRRTRSSAHLRALDGGNEASRCRALPSPTDHLHLVLLDQALGRETPLVIRCRIVDDGFDTPPVEAAALVGLLHERARRSASSVGEGGGAGVGKDAPIGMAAPCALPRPGLTETGGEAHP